MCIRDSLETAHKFGMKVLRVPGYSPEAVAEHAMALALKMCIRDRSICSSLHLLYRSHGSSQKKIQLSLTGLRIS